MPNICDDYTQVIHTININFDAAFQAMLTYNLIYFDLFGPITSVGYNSIKYVAFVINDLLYCQ